MVPSRTWILLRAVFLVIKKYLLFLKIYRSVLNTCLVFKILISKLIMHFQVLIDLIFSSTSMEYKYLIYRWKFVNSNTFLLSYDKFEFQLTHALQSRSNETCSTQRKIAATPRNNHFRGTHSLVCLCPLTSATLCDRVGGNNKSPPIPRGSIPF